MVQRRKLTAFIRSFHDKYVQEIAKKAGPGASYESVKMLFAWNKEKNLVQVTVSAVKERILQPVAGTEVKLFAKRYFGNLLIDEARTTDNQGIVSCNFPKNLPGDAQGSVSLTAKPIDEAAFGEAKADTAMAIGVATNRPPLNEPRALWNVVQNTPIWLLLTYTLTVLAVWGFIFYVLLQVRTVFKSGKS